MKYKIKEFSKKNITSEFFTTLNNLSKTVKKNIKKGRKAFKHIQKNKNHRIFVAINEDEQVIGLTTLLIERKFIHEFGKLGHIEDVVVREGFEGNGIGGALIEKAKKVAKKEDCYRIVLNCSDDNIKFYEKYGYKKKENEMALEL
ncbi:MAG: GNAT family N-acetyltransferase [Candidatus Kerfeldbacteria bacterium]|jgi:glucosamine-phosphate N-acetyltransferase